MIEFSLKPKGWLKIKLINPKGRSCRGSACRSAFRLWCVVPCQHRTQMATHHQHSPRNHASKSWKWHPTHPWAENLLVLQHSSEAGPLAYCTHLICSVIFTWILTLSPAGSTVSHLQNTTQLKSPLFQTVLAPISLSMKPCPLEVADKAPGDLFLRRLSEFRLFSYCPPITSFQPSLSVCPWLGFSLVSPSAYNLLASDESINSYSFASLPKTDFSNKAYLILEMSLFP